jgi:polyisoprenoid-binding protein YceI
MKKTILTLLVFGSILMACSNKGEKATTKAAEKVETSKGENAVAYNVVLPESNVDWRASHLGGVQPRYGVISLKSAEVSVTNNKVTNANIIMDMTSFTVDNFEDEESKNKLTGHLQSDDFFKVESFPTSTFELTNTVEATGDYNSTITGNLTILEATKSITFKANITISESNISIKSEDFVVDRTDWGLVYHVEGSEGVPVDYLISNDVGFTINTSLGK